MNLTSRPIKVTSRRGDIFIPFITSSPIFDVQLLLLLFPLWWVIGVEQLVWPIGFSLVLLKCVVMQHYVIRISRTVKWLLLFLLIHLVSGLFIVETFRWVTFFRNLSTYVAFFALHLILTNRIKNWHQIESLLKIYVGIMSLTALAGLLAILDIWQPDFTSLLGNFMPGWIKATSYGERIATRSVGNWSWFSFLRRYFRVHSFFLYATLYASALATAIPTTLYLFHDSPKIKMKVIYAVGMILMGINIVYTTGRIAIIGCLAGAIFYLTFFSRWRTLTKIVFVLGLIGLVVFVLQTDSLTVFVDLYEDFVFARGSGSFYGRSEVYRVTLEQFAERPFFGWGTERDIPDFPFPAGSHSYYLGILYKHGLFGLIAFLGFLISIWWESRPIKSKPHHNQNKSATRFLLYGRWIIVAFAINSFTDVLELDATTLVFFGLVTGLLIKTRYLLKGGQILQENT